MSRIISASLSPDTDWRDVREALHVLFSPAFWQRGAAITDVSAWFAKEYGAKQPAFFTSGRAALTAVLTALGIGAGDEVLVQAFTCVAVPNSVLWAGATPVYTDIDGTLNMDPRDAGKRITAHTRAIIVQHTFGVPADMKRIIALAEKHGLYVIEDCAHALGVAADGKKAGSWGDAAVFSFGRDKVLSSVWGGAAVIHSHCRAKGASDRLNAYHRDAPYPSSFWIFRELLHPVAFWCILPLYTIGIGKLMLVTLQKLSLLSKPVEPEEYRGGKPAHAVMKYPNALARLLYVQLSKFYDMTAVRKEAAAIYRRDIPPAFTRVPARAGASYLRYPVFAEEPELNRQTAKKQGILLGNWYHHVIDPGAVSFSAVGYRPGSCPKAEYAAAHILNLPTLVSPGDAHLVVEALAK